MLLIDALCRDFTSQLLKVVSARPVMEIDDAEFNREVAKELNLIFETWKNESRKMESVADR